MAKSRFLLSSPNVLGLDTTGAIGASRQYSDENQMNTPENTIKTSAEVDVRQEQHENSRTQ